MKITMNKNTAIVSGTALTALIVGVIAYRKHRKLLLSASVKAMTTPPAPPTEDLKPSEPTDSTPPTESTPTTPPTDSTPTTPPTESTPPTEEPLAYIDLSKVSPESQATIGHTVTGLLEIISDLSERIDTIEQSVSTLDRNHDMFVDVCDASHESLKKNIEYLYKNDHDQMDIIVKTQENMNGFLEAYAQFQESVIGRFNRLEDTINKIAKLWGDEDTLKDIAAMDTVKVTLSKDTPSTPDKEETDHYE